MYPSPNPPGEKTMKKEIVKAHSAESLRARFAAAKADKAALSTAQGFAGF